MIKGTLSWNNKSIRYNQELRVIEKFLADLKISKQCTFWLESCNVCAAACSVEAIGAIWKNNLPTVSGVEIITQADLMFDYIYSAACGAYKKDGVCENEIPENLARAITALSNAQAELHYYQTARDTVYAMREAVKNGHAGVFSYLTDYKSGHYICAVAYDEDDKTFICYDSWTNNTHCKNGGVQEKYTIDFLIERIRTRFIDVHK